MAGPLPTAAPRRRNAPTIPTTKLPVTGRSGPVPRPPKMIALAEKGQAWWRWAWKTPQAAAWSTGDLQVVARRARLEDDWDMLESLNIELPPIEEDFDDPFDFAEAMRRYAASLRELVMLLARLARGSLNVEREMRELDDRLGLTPKARAQLRWDVVDDTPEDTAGAEDEMSKRRAEREAQLAAANS